LKSLISLEECKNTNNVGLVLSECDVGKEHWWNDTNTGRKVILEKSAPLQLCPTQSLHEVAGERIWVYAW